VYMGYFVKGCSSMQYKRLYRPCEVLTEEGEWRTFEGG
jgi:arginine-tRNA-protein transferase